MVCLSVYFLKDEKGNLLADTKNYLTSERSIYAAGDARRGQSLQVWAIRGREACFSYSWVICPLDSFTKIVYIVILKVTSCTYYLCI